MTRTFDFALPWVLLLLPLALLPLLPGRRDVLTFSWTQLLPRDRLGQLAGLLWRAFAAIAIASIVLGLAEPGRPETQIARTGKGAEILVLMDRSRSMDERMLPSDWRTIDPLSLLHQMSRGPQKAQVARTLLSKFVTQRPDDRFSLMFFSTRPLNVMPFTQHDEAIQAGISAGGVGRGLAETNVGKALIASIDSFERRAYTGSRIILLVSDGGTQLDDPTRRRIKAGLLRNRIALYWIYLRTYNSPPLDSADPKLEAIGEVALHRFFLSLSTPYRAYQAEVEEDLAKAVADVGQQQNLPLEFMEQIPRQDYSRRFIAAGALACLMLLGYRGVLLRSWR
ncbi:MAG: vWA domain-containing protein [Gammaproteobacteria bacterium]